MKSRRIVKSWRDDQVEFRWHPDKDREGRISVLVGWSGYNTLLLFLDWAIADAHESIKC